MSLAAAPTPPETPAIFNMFVLDNVRLVTSVYVVSLNADAPTTVEAIIVATHRTTVALTRINVIEISIGTVSCSVSVNTPDIRVIVPTLGITVA